MRYFPAFFDIENKPVLIAGGGELALRKARLLIKASPDLVFVAPDFSDELVAAFGERARFLERAFVAADLALEPALVVVATGEADTDEEIALAVRSAGIPVNVVDRPELCDFVVPSIVDRGDLVIGISTGGAAPVLGRSLRAKIESLLPQRLGALAGFAKQFRTAVTARIPETDRKHFWERFFSGPIAEDVLAGREVQAREAMLAHLNQPSNDSTGVVHIVGAGPGDPELLTLKALRVLQETDVVLHDNLVSDGIMELIRRDAERIYVGKKKADHAMPQEEIGTLMVRLAREGKKVVRLKGGDPFIFGRGGEELDVLRAAGIAADVVPGITAATGCGAAASVPLTHRDFSQAVTFVTGHAKGEAEPDINWHALAELGHTLVIYMGVGTAPRTSSALLRAGMRADMPVAIVEKGTTPEQKIIRTTLQDLPADLVAGGIKGPAVLIIGEVAAKAEGIGLVELAVQEEQQRLRA
jgi:uroporphyrin-III C-methyltransferase/precorrin-2 dehydrogenase/sirohydrochlorin ferrochelatase